MVIFRIFVKIVGTKYQNTIMETYKIIKLGDLKYSRIKSMSILKRELNCFYSYNNSEIKDLFETLLSSNFNEEFGLKYKRSFDLIFENMEYQIINDDEYYENDCHFPICYIIPTC